MAQSARLFVGGLNPSTNAPTLGKLFETIGKVFVFLNSFFV